MPKPVPIHSSMLLLIRVARSKRGQLPIGATMNEEIRQAILDEPRCRSDHTYHTTESATKTSSQPRSRKWKERRGQLFRQKKTRTKSGRKVTMMTRMRMGRRVRMIESVARFCLGYCRSKVVHSEEAEER